MPVSTFSAAIHITPIFVKTFFENYKKKAGKLVGWKFEDLATDDIFYDEAFNIVKSFLELATQNTIESLQAFTNTHVPAPYWAAVAPVRIPLASCNQAADILVDWFGPSELRSVVGGERWWQVRGLDGIEGEWITQKAFLPPAESNAHKSIDEAKQTIRRMDQIRPVLLYVHGGGYFFGSINTHRYQIIRYARKMKGRAFAMNYRKAPQYPWPCAVQDVLAAYLYLIQPPTGAVHTAIPPDKIVFAGDSAGGGLCLTALTILRDMGMPMPAGGVLISPWVDMTHTFPSVMENVETDIIPPHGFMAKPSTLWPVDSDPPGGRIVPTVTDPPPNPGHADTLKPSDRRVAQRVSEIFSCTTKTAKESQTLESARSADAEAGLLSTVQLGEATEEFVHKGELCSIEKTVSDSSEEPNGQQVHHDAGLTDEERGAHPVNPDLTSDDQSSQRTAVNSMIKKELCQKLKNEWEPKPPKVLMEDPLATPLELRAQIQIYATNEQLTHPLVSPLLQGSLGNLPPLYIIAGDGEALRDEVIYVAHRAAHPEKYPVREGVLREGKRQQENAKKFTTPTKVHLQVYDGMCHVLTVFTFTDSAKYAYRSIAQFVRHVTSHSSDHLAKNPFPEYHRPPAHIPSDTPARRYVSPTKRTGRRVPHLSREPSSDSSDIAMFMDNEDIALQEMREGKVGKDKDNEVGATGDDIAHALMIRERVDIYGQVRAMESPDDIAILHIPPSQIGIIKEAPVRRWLRGQDEWDRKYKHTAERVRKQRRKNEIKAARMITHARDKGLLMVDETSPVLPRTESETSLGSLPSTGGVIQEERRWGPLDLEGENVPPSAICNRRDTPESSALLKKTIYHTAPVTHRTIPRVPKRDLISSALDPHDRVGKPPRQSASEQQQTENPLHGISMWDSLVGYFMRRSATKVEHGNDHIVHGLSKADDRVLQSPSGSGSLPRT
ncbi:alpha/beta-hydrolase [Punctularia strigosozonata HHB-11173 SS5]|uniref:alpha/beta-hydrolase n=1 Tax=Punctularia strigosozonata (strain HHB-11173) TaxID=741275 RepID=UPI0004418505|nr:alpha/beta-hydrolase [Punctularia strigosozonata HHB-11173 SS5]EIN10888.1 alpha/beta-hydrolase [Punctularia strigosozonata HHB-11173 SS5]